MTLKPLMSVTAELDGIYELSVIHLSSLPISMQNSLYKARVRE